MPVAETLGVVGSIIAIVQISKTIISICQFYIDALDGASSDLRVILIEVSTIKGIAKSLQYLTQPNVANSTLLDQLAAVTGPIEGCKEALKELETLFPPVGVSVKGRQSKRRKLDAAVTALAWPLKAGKAKKLLQEMIQHKTTINLALTAEFVHDLKDVKQKTGQIQNLLTENERRDIYKWLETTNPSDIHNRSQKLYESGTGSWMLRTPQWPLWVEGKHRCLWIHGIPGAGKSILASYLAEEIENHCVSSSSESSKLGHAYYYCYFGHNHDEASHFLRWVIGQLCRQSATVPEELHNIYKSGKTPTFSSLLSILHKIIADFERVYVILDAVDESMPREDLLRVIRDLSMDVRFSSLSLLVTSRQYIDIEQVWEACSIPITMSNSFVEEDIRTLVHSTVQSDAKYQRWPEELRLELQGTIPKKAKGMFRWAVCQLDSLKRLRPDVSVIRAALSDLPKTLDETYERIFLAISEDDWLSVQHVFHWMVYHNELFRTNITVDTLLQAVQQSTPNFLSSAADQLHDFESLRERCGCPIMIEQAELKRRDGTEILHRPITVSFAHYTVKEYLQSSRISQRSIGFFALVEEKIQKQFAEIVFRQALAIRPNKWAELDVGSGNNIYPLLDEDFKLYCRVSSALQLKIWSEAISSETSLMELSEALVNPYRSEYPDFSNLLMVADDELDLAGKSGLDFEFQFWQIHWAKELDPNAAVFLNLLLSSGYAGTPHLAIAFAKRHSMLGILTRQLHIKKNVWGPFDENVTKPYEFVGSIPEIVSQWSFKQSQTYDFILELIEEEDGTHFDISELLLLCISSHDHVSCNKTCHIERLLLLRANAKGPEGAFVTPLQIAVSCWDLKGMETLLNAGAEPNALGKDGSGRASNMLMEQFNYLHGVSPLHIIKHLECSYRVEMKDALCRDEATREKIEARLLEAGAVEIRPEGLELKSDHVSDEDGDSEDYTEEDEGSSSVDIIESF